MVSVTSCQKKSPAILIYISVGYSDIRPHLAGSGLNEPTGWQWQAGIRYSRGETKTG